MYPKYQLRTELFSDTFISFLDYCWCFQKSSQNSTFLKNVGGLYKAALYKRIMASEYLFQGFRCYHIKCKIYSLFLLLSLLLLSAKSRQKLTTTSIFSLPILKLLTVCCHYLDLTFNLSHIFFSMFSEFHFQLSE